MKDKLNIFIFMRSTPLIVDKNLNQKIVPLETLVRTTSTYKQDMLQMLDGKNKDILVNF